MERRLQLLGGKHAARKKAGKTIYSKITTTNVFRFQDSRSSSVPFIAVVAAFTAFRTAVQPNRA